MILKSKLSVSVSVLLSVSVPGVSVVSSHSGVLWWFVCSDEAREDLLSLMALLDVWFFRLECPDHTLADVQGWLQESLRFERLEIDPHFTADPSGVPLFRWEQNSPFQGVLSVYCRWKHGLSVCFSHVTFAMFTGTEIRYMDKSIRTPPSKEQVWLLE